MLQVSVEQVTIEAIVPGSTVIVTSIFQSVEDAATSGVSVDAALEEATVESLSNSLGVDLEAVQVTVVSSTVPSPPPPSTTSSSTGSSSSGDSSSSRGSNGNAEDTETSGRPAAIRVRRDVFVAGALGGVGGLVFISIGVTLIMKKRRWSNAAVEDPVGGSGELHDFDGDTLDAEGASDSAALR